MSNAGLSDNQLDNQSIQSILPKKVINKFGLDNHNYVIYEKKGVDGKVHRNFVTVDEEGNRIVPPSMKNIHAEVGSRS